MNRALDQFLIATALIQDGDRASALKHLRAAQRAARCAKNSQSAEFIREIDALIARVSRNMTREAA